MIIIGAGLSGLIAANLLRDEVEGIWEAQPELPNNHNAILRFRSDIVSVTTNIPFKEVQVMKAVEPYMNPFADMIAYSRKVTGIAQSRSIITANGSMDKRYIAPPDFIERLYKRVQNRIVFNAPWKMENIGVGPFISTIPMPALMTAMGYEYESGTFKYRQGFVVRGRLPGFNAYGTVYVPDPGNKIYRVSVTGDELFIECIGKLPADGDKSETMQRYLKRGLEIIGCKGFPIVNVITPTIKNMVYAKINEVDERIRKDFILWASEHGVYSLGRFATWRPSLLLDDLIKDINVIRRLTSGDRTPNYMMRKSQS